MRIVHFAADGADGWGTLDDADQVTPLVGCGSLAEVIVALGDQDLQAGPARRFESVVLRSPVAPLVRNVFCVGWNYVDHFAEGRTARGPGGAQEIPDRPTFFTKATGAIVGPTDPIESHRSISETLDWEVELAVVIGRRGRDIAEDAALNHVLGYTVANDVSARNIQRGHGGQWFRGKSLDGTSPIGPWITTRDAFGPIERQRITCRVNGETMQDATLGDLHFGVPRIIAELSAGLTLLPGDVILTGTPSGVGFARDPAIFLSPGDVVESEIEGIGTMRNVVTA
jgi:2,4-didehydro-3-deoxy-L-rhamnonate hydrolase